jgi:RNA polymerase sigma-70 factor (ECF subfamily)
MPDLGAAYEAHAGALYAFLRRRGATHEDAEDLVADTFVRALAAAATYEERGYPLSAWLYRIARGRQIDLWRQQGRRPSVAIDAVCVAVESIEHTIIGRVWCQELLAAADLTERQRAAIAQRIVYSQTLGAAAAAMQTSRGAVKALQRRALVTLAQAHTS